MKTTLASVPQSSGYPLKIVEQEEKETSSPIVPLNNEISTIVPPRKDPNVTDAPEAWDESWFANYE